MDERVKMLKLRLPEEKNTELLKSYVDEAESMILGITQRKTLPNELNSACARLAIILYNRQGIEGESNHSEGGVQVGVEALPEDLRRQIAPFRLAKTRYDACD